MFFARELLGSISMFENMFENSIPNSEVLFKGLLSSGSSVRKWVFSYLKIESIHFLWYNLYETQAFPERVEN